MNKTEKQSFRAICLRDYENDQAVKEMDRVEREEKDDAERHEKLITFLKLHLLDQDVEVEKLEIKNAFYQDDRFILTVGSREEKFPIMAGIECSKCDEVFVWVQVRDIAQIGAVMSESKQAKCPNCEETDDFEAGPNISPF